MTSIVLVIGGPELLPIVQPLWEMLNQHHLDHASHFQQYYENLVFEQRQAVLLEKSRNGQLRVTLAKDVDLNRWVGYCISTITYRGEGEIDSLFILSEYRGSGTGERVMRDAVDWMNRNAVPDVKLVVAAGNEQVFPFYEKFGFFPKYTTLVQNTEPEKTD